MNERDVRKALYMTELVHHSDGDTRVIDELGLIHGEARVDVAVINGVVHGFEIKSDADTLNRLQRQAAAYERVLDLMTLVAPMRHVNVARKSLPACWGLLSVECATDGTVVFTNIRRARRNTKLDAIAVASLLWRTEALSILEDVGHSTGLRYSRRSALYERLASVLRLNELRGRVRECLKNRSGWRVAGRRT